VTGLRAPDARRIALTIGACALIALGFFLPWVEGADLMDLRSFSGFDLARLVRNFEINADSEAGLGQLRATALSLYLVPALAINAAVIECMSAGTPTLGPAGRLAALVSGVYVLLVLAVVLFLAQVPVNHFEVVVGTPSWGFAATAIGGAALVVRASFVPSVAVESV
jgi:hypothetical protein